MTTAQILPRRRHYRLYYQDTYTQSDGTVRAYHLWSQESGRYALVYPTGETDGAGQWWPQTRVLLYHDGNETHYGADLIATYRQTDAALAFARAWVSEPGGSVR